MSRQRVSNPLSTPGIFLIVLFIGLFLIAEFTKLDRFVAPLTLPLSFFCTVFAIAWFFFQYKTGQVTLVSQNGGAHTYTRKKNPVWFFSIIIIGVTMAAFLAVVLGVEMLLACEWSLINTC